MFSSNRCARAYSSFLKVLRYHQQYISAYSAHPLLVDLVTGYDPSRRAALESPAQFAALGRKELTLHTVPGPENPADLFTKATDAYADTHPGVLTDAYFPRPRLR